MRIQTRVLGGTAHSHWFLNDQTHRSDGPAVITVYGAKVWYRDGSLHRLDGPAIIFPNGAKEWYHKGKLHRLDGPASAGSDEWYYHGTPLDQILAVPVNRITIRKMRWRRIWQKIRAFRWWK